MFQCYKGSFMKYMLIAYITVCECINILVTYNVISGSACDMLSLINYIFFITPLLCANLFGMTEHL